MTSSNEAVTETPAWTRTKKVWQQRDGERYKQSAKDEGDQLKLLFDSYVESAGDTYSESDLLAWALRKLERSARRAYIRAAEESGYENPYDYDAYASEEAAASVIIIAKRLRADVRCRASNGQQSDLKFPRYESLFGYVAESIKCYRDRAFKFLKKQTKSEELLFEGEDEGDNSGKKYLLQNEKITKKVKELDNAALKDDRTQRAIRNEDWEIVDYLPAKAQKFFDQWQELRFVKADYCEHYCVPSNTFDQMVKRFRERVAELRAIVESFGQGYRIGLVCFRNAVTQVRLSNEADLPQTFADVIALGPKTLPAKFKTEQLDGWQRTVSDGPLETGFKRDVQTAMKIILKLWREPAPSNVINLQAAAEEGSVVGDIRKRQSMLNADELAELLNLSRKHIYRMAKAGRMPSYRIGGAIRFDPATVATWLEEKSIAA